MIDIKYNVFSDRCCIIKYYLVLIDIQVKVYQIGMWQDLLYIGSIFIIYGSFTCDWREIKGPLSKVSHVQVCRLCHNISRL